MSDEDRRTTPPSSPRAALEREAQRLKRQGWDPRAHARRRAEAAAREASSPKPSAAALAHEVRLLKQRQGWDPERMTRETPLERLQQLDQELRDQEVYAATDACPACADARAASRDDTALCQAHLAEAMGF